MKKLSLIAFLISSTAFAATINLGVGETQEIGGFTVSCGVAQNPLPDPNQVVSSSCSCQCQVNLCNLVLTKTFASGQSASETLQSGIYSSFRCEQAENAERRCHM